VLGLGLLWPLGLAAAAAALLAAVRPPILAGTWYPGDQKSLEREVAGFLADAEAPAGRPLAIIAPHAGYVYSGRCAGEAHGATKGFAYKRVVLLAPSHYAGFSGMALPDVTAFATPLGEMSLDIAAVSALAETSPFKILPAAHAREHSVEIQVPFIQVAHPDALLVPIVVGVVSEADIVAAAAALSKLAADGTTLLVASSDFTHHGPRFGFVLDGEPSKVVPALDRGAIDLILARDWRGFLSYVDATGATICGAYPIATVVAALPQGCKGELLAYHTSAEVTGDWEDTVSYAAIAFFGETKGAKSAIQKTAATKEPKGKTVQEERAAEAGLSAEERQTLLLIARRTLEAHLAGSRAPDFEKELPLTDALRESRGAFVTLVPRAGTECERQFRNLRGCIGYVRPVKPLWETVRDNAISAATRDPRFPPMSREEAGQVRIEISAMSPLEVCEDPAAIVVGKHGLLISSGMRSGLLLPQVPGEFGWDREEFLAHTCNKAGLPSDAWKKGARIETFTAEVFGEEE